MKKYRHKKKKSIQLATRPSRQEEKTVQPGDPLFKFYETLHYHQIDVRDKLHTKFQIFLVAAIPLIGCIITMMKATPPHPFLSMPFSCVLNLLALLYLFCASFFFVSSYIGKKYFFMGYAIDIDEYRKHDLVPKKEFEVFLLEDLISTTSKNQLVNDKRSKEIFIGNCFTIVAVCLVIIAFILSWICGSYMELPKLNDQKGQCAMTEKPEAKPPATPQPVAQKPQQPPQREVRNSSDKKSK